MGAGGFVHEDKSDGGGGGEADHSPTIDEVKKDWSYISHPPYVYMVQCLIMHTEKFNLGSNEFSN
jgi:hypothetical protein